MIIFRDGMVVDIHRHSHSLDITLPTQEAPTLLRRISTAMATLMVPTCRRHSPGIRPILLTTLPSRTASQPRRTSLVFATHLILHLQALLLNTANRTTILMALLDTLTLTLLTRVITTVWPMVLMQQTKRFPWPPPLVIVTTILLQQAMVLLPVRWKATGSIRLPLLKDQVLLPQ